jgi:hypothetical protein
MQQMTQAERSRMFELVFQRDGECCHVGTEELGKGDVFLIPWDSDPTNRDPDNWRIVCERISLLISPPSRRRKKDQAGSNSKSVCESHGGFADEPPRNTSLEFLKNLRAQPCFLHWLFEQVFVRQKVPYREVLNGGAYVARITQKTTREYTDKQTSPQGMYLMVRESEERFVKLKPQWETFRRVIEGRKKADRQARNWLKDELVGLKISTSKPGHWKGQSRPDQSSGQQPTKPERPP